MKTKTKKTIFIVILAILSGLIIWKVFTFQSSARKISIPTPQSRNVKRYDMYKNVTVKDISLRHNVSQKKIFEYLKIIPKAGDENLSLEKLGKKYNISSQEMRKSIKDLMEFIKAGKKNGKLN